MELNQAHRPTLDDEEMKSQLKEYAPVLRFSVGERFFPMDVNDYILACNGLYDGKDLFKELSEPDAEKRFQSLAFYSAEEHKKLRKSQSESQDGVNGQPPEKPMQLNLHLIQRVEKQWNWVKIRLALVVFLLTVMIIFGAAWLSGGSTGFHPDPVAALLITLLAFFISWHPIITADSKVHFVIAINLFGWLFWGTAYAVELGVFALVLLLGCLAVFFFFQSIFRRQPINLPSVERQHRVNIFVMAVIGALSGLILGLLFPAAPNSILALGFSMGGLYAALWYSQKIARSKEWLAIRLLSGIAALIAILMVSAVLFHWLPLAETILFATVLAGMGLAWYALEPFAVIRHGPIESEEEYLKRKESLQPQETKRERQIVFGWDGRMLGLIFAVIFVFTLTSWHFSRIQPISFEQIITALVVHLLVSGINLAFSIGILGTRAASYILDVKSGNDDADVEKAEDIYKEKSQNSPGRYPVYARYCTEGKWTILLYNYFYAYNDWRSTAGGMNNHEGDWEAVAVFLLNKEQESKELETPKLDCKKPFGVAYSQHHNGEFRYWEDVVKMKGKDQKNTCHPLVYVALGSHANYPEPGILSPEVQFEGLTRKMVSGLGAIEYFVRQKTGIAKHKVEEAVKANQLNVQSQRMNQGKENLGKIPFSGDPARAQKSRYKKPLQGGDLLPGALEYAAGDGLRIGCCVDDADLEQEFCGYTPNLPDAIKFEERYFDPRPPEGLGTWRIVLVKDSDPFIQYRGIWGRWVNMEGEDGPRGPKWDAVDQWRYRWGGAESGPNQDYYIIWLHVLLMEICLDQESAPHRRWQSFQELAKL